MSARAGAAAARVAATIRRVGRPVVLLRPGAPSGSRRDPVPGVPVETPLYAVADDASTEELPGDLLAVHARAYLIAGAHALGANLRLRDDDGTEYEVIGYEETRPGTVRYLSRVLVRL